MRVNPNPRVTSMGSIPGRRFERFDTPNPFLIFTVLLINGCALYQLTKYVLGYESPRMGMFVYQSIVSLLAGIASTAGAHRLWSHKSYKAVFPLRLFFMVFHTLTIQFPVYTWVRWHRLHHKLSGTDADPHDVSRGFFYAQIGWVFLYDPEKFNRNAAGQIETKDLEQDEVIMWQYRNYNWWVVFMLTLQLLTPLALGLEGSIVTVWGVTCMGVALKLFVVGTVNSFAHMWGARPYDKSSQSTQNSFIAFIAIGEGWHNYHHTFPSDYRSSEFGLKYDFTQMVIHCFHYMGWAYDLRTTSLSVVEKRAGRTGDGSVGKHSNEA